MSLKRLATLATLLPTLLVAACRFDVDTGRFRVQWVVQGLDCSGEPTPVVRVRSAAQSTSADEDDEYFDWLPCVSETGAPEGLTAPIPLGSYDVTAELYTERDGTLLGRSGQQPGQLGVQDEVVSVFLTIDPAPPP